MSLTPPAFHELLSQLGTVFERYVPWHSEAEKISALETIAATQAHLIAADAQHIAADVTTPDLSKLPADLHTLVTDVAQVPQAFWPAAGTPGLVSLPRTPDVAQPQSDAVPVVAEENPDVQWAMDMDKWIVDSMLARAKGMSIRDFNLANPQPMYPYAPALVADGQSGTSGTSGDVAQDAVNVGDSGDFVYPVMPEKSGE